MTSDNGGFACRSNHCCNFLLAALVAVVIRCTAPTGLKQLIYFIIADLKITPARLCNISRIRLVQHIVTVLSVLNTQTKSEFCIWPNVIVNRTARFLCCKNKVNSKTSSDLCNTDQLTHKIGFFLFQLRKFINYDNKVRNRCGSFTALIQPRVVVYVIHTVFAENSLTAKVFALNWNHRSANLITRKVRNLTCHMR